MKTASKWVAAVTALCMMCTAAITVSAAGEETVETSKLVAYYEFENPDALGRDSTGNGHDLNKIINAANISTETGVKGTALKLAGSAGLAAWEEGAEGDFMDALGSGSKGYTVSLYAKVDIDHCRGDGSNARVFCNGWNGASEGMSVLLNYNTDGSIACLAPFGSLEWWSTYSGIGGDKAADWHHIVAVYNPDNGGKGRYSIYVDGIQTVDLECGTEEPVSCASWFFCIGGCWTPQCDWFPDDSVTTDSFIGSVDEFKVFSEAIYDMDFINAAVPEKSETGGGSEGGGEDVPPKTGCGALLIAAAAALPAAAGSLAVLTGKKRYGR